MMALHLTKPATRYRLLMLGAILIVLLNTWFASQALARLFSAQHWLAHTLETLTQTEEIFVDMSQANGAPRAFCLRVAQNSWPGIERPPEMYTWRSMASSN